MLLNIEKRFEQQLRRFRPRRVNRQAARHHWDFKRRPLDLDFAVRTICGMREIDFVQIEVFDPVDQILEADALREVEEAIIENLIKGVSPTIVSGRFSRKGKTTNPLWLSHDPHGSLAGSSRICICLKCLSNCRCMVLIAACGFLANPGPPNVKYVSQLEHLPCSPDLSFWVISRCGFFMHQVSQGQDSRSSPVDFKLHHYHFEWLVPLENLEMSEQTGIILSIL
jgi:hypothetical protein